MYFIATRLLRDQGAGPTLLVSPLLALMRNQIEAAERMGVRAATINSANRDEWGELEEGIAGGRVDLLLISPERLANSKFRTEVLPVVERVYVPAARETAFEWERGSVTYTKVRGRGRATSHRFPRLTDHLIQIGCQRR